MSTYLESTKQSVTEILKLRSIERFGFSTLTRPLTMDIYLNWIEESQHGEMAYLKMHAEKKEKPQMLLPKARSAIVLAFQYLPHPEPQSDFVLKGSRTALYSRGKDYHHWIGAKLKELCLDLYAQFPEEEFAGFVDSGPVLERDLARRASLGWIGKNTCLIHPKFGSLFFLAEIYTSLELSGSQSLQSDHCGTCQKCIEICPTQALTERSLDARKCISYLTIESKSVPPPALRTQINDWLFGCDLCQTVCPWNIKFFKHEIAKENHIGKKEDLIQDLKFILGSSNKTLIKSFQDSSLSRASGNKLKRNAMIVIANKKLTELKELVATYSSNEYFAELCRWTLAELEAT